VSICDKKASNNTHTHTHTQTHTHKHTQTKHIWCVCMRRTGGQRTTLTRSSGVICCRETGVKGPIPKAAAARAQYIPSPYMGTTTEGQPAASAAWNVPTQIKGGGKTGSA
jgi:hypothetical protein